jgi:hypothetical protein
MNTLNFGDFVENLRTTNIPDTQIEIYRKNTIIMQIFKSSDVIRWGWNVNDIKKSGVVISLIFNKHKPENSENHYRFQNSSYFIFFQKQDLKGNDKYVLYTKRDSDEIGMLVADILNKTYDLGDEEVEVFLNSY